MGQPGFWDDQEQAQAIVGKLKGLKTTLKPMEEMVSHGENIQAALELAEMDDTDEALAAELTAELDATETLLEELRLTALLNGEHDNANAIVTINARDGGTDANDWAEMLMRMYIRWAEGREATYEILDRDENDEAGINSASLAIRAPYAYGYLKGETGTHRLVRISPFNSEGKRQTSFAFVDVSPEVDDNIDIEVKEEDLDVTAMRSGGAGGQHVNKTSSAVRMVHKPTGVAVRCEAERSQHKNRATALKMLKARLVQIEVQKREEEEQSKYENRPKTGFGSQIRNYFLHPDQRVKDNRTGYLVGNFHSVLDGNIQEFLEAYLRWRVGEEVAQKSA